MLLVATPANPCFFFVSTPSRHPSNNICIHEHIVPDPSYFPFDYLPIAIQTLSLDTSLRNKPDLSYLLFSWNTENGPSLRAATAATKYPSGVWLQGVVACAIGRREFRRARSLAGEDNQAGCRVNRRARGGPAQSSVEAVWKHSRCACCGAAGWKRAETRVARLRTHKVCGSERKRSSDAEQPPRGDLCDRRSV